jgi:hypothetical protein
VYKFTYEGRCHRLTSIHPKISSAGCLKDLAEANCIGRKYQEASPSFPAPLPDDSQVGCPSACHKFQQLTCQHGPSSRIHQMAFLMLGNDGVLERGGGTEK